ncbi:hypothetical protein N181_12420 [Sinorhizobium fredii USDA 205]|uniref:Uncharacterized protein n=1 Tax=Rhizobium fredii TaxID=380 RepID=A0A844AK46_RHIFR|nr:hypothetical protein [Sinorhizobium fredii]KSV90400.1 hypothetical protein N181_12420 [Sinorhizobium fredii USDA 205]MQX12178.1 hypothetical protein [Sinorhizobium fredii]
MVDPAVPQAFLTAHKSTHLPLVRVDSLGQKAKKNKAKALFFKFRVIFQPLPAAANERA